MLLGTRQAMLQNSDSSNAIFFNVAFFSNRCRVGVTFTMGLHSGGGEPATGGLNHVSINTHKGCTQAKDERSFLG